MARAAAQYVFAALLALLTAQTAVPSRHLVSPAEIDMVRRNRTAGG